MALLLKAIFVYGLAVAGVVFLAHGLGVTIPFVKFKEFEAHEVPVGVVLLAAAVAVSYFWRISSKTIRTETYETHSEGGSWSKRQTTTETDRSAYPLDGPHNRDPRKRQTTTETDRSAAPPASRWDK